MKQTAVDWLINQLPNIDWIDPWYRDKLSQAKAMEKEQMKSMFDCGRQYQLTGEGTFTQVHNETFK